MSMMIRLLRDLLRSYWQEHASNQIKLQKSKLLIYDEHLNKYVSADELLIPGIKVKNKRPVTYSKSKEFFAFDVFFKKFVNPKLDLLVPFGVKSLDILIKRGTKNKQENIATSSIDNFWGTKKIKRHVVFPLPPVNSKNTTDTEIHQVGWAGQMTRKPNTDPRPELGKTECKFGPGKDPKKKRPPKKKSKKSKYLVCRKVKKLKKNIKDGNNKTDIAKGISKASKDIIYNEENCYYDSKETVKKLKLQGALNSESTTLLKSIVKKEKLMENLEGESEKNPANKKGVVKVISSKLFSNEVNLKKPTTKESISDPLDKMNACDQKANTSLKRNENNSKKSLKENNENKNILKHESDLKVNQSKALECKKHQTSSLMSNKGSKTSNLYLCKQQNLKPKNENKLHKTEESMCSKKLSLPGTGKTNEIKSDEKAFNCDEEKDKNQIINSDMCLNKAKNEECANSKSFQDSGIKDERKKAMTKKSSTLTLETPVCSTGITINEKNMRPTKTTEGRDGEKAINTCTCFDNPKVDDSSTCKSKKDFAVDKIKQECKQVMIQRPKATPDCTKTKEQTTLNNSNKLSTAPCNLTDRLKSVDIQESCSKTNSLIPSHQPRGDCNSNEQNIMQENEKSKFGNEEPCKCPTTKVSKENTKCNETNDPEKQNQLEWNTSKCLNIDSKSTEKLECITQEEFFKKADSSTDLTKCSSYLGFKVKKPCSKTKPTTENICEDNDKTCAKKRLKENTKTKKSKSKTALKSVKSCDKNLQSKTNCNNLKNSKSESCLSKGAIKTTSQDLKKVNTKSICEDNVSPSNAKSKTKVICGSSSKHSLKDKKKKSSPKKSPSKTKESKKCKSKSSLDLNEDSKSKNVEKNKNIIHCSNKEHNNNQKNEKLSDCKTPSNSSAKDVNEVINDDNSNDGSCCKNLNNQKPNDQDKKKCCKKAGKETVDEVCTDKRADKDIVQCPTSQEKTKETTDKNNIGKCRSKEINVNKKTGKPKDLKHIITGAKQKKKATLCKNITPLQSVKSQGNSKIDKSKTKLTSSKTSQKNKDKVQVYKSAMDCSKQKSSTSIDKKSKKSKSKQSICSKTSKGSLSGGMEKKNKSQKVETLTKLNKLVHRAKCGTASGDGKKKIVKHALICSQSSPNIQPVKNNKKSRLLKPNETITKKPSTSSISNSNAKKINGSKNEAKNTKMCSVHTLQKRMPETAIKNSKRIDVKSFRELKTMNNTSRRDMSAECFENSFLPPQLDSQWNNQITGTMSVKDTGLLKECKLVNTGQNIEQNSLKISNWKESTLLDPKHKKFSPFFKSDKCLQLLLAALKHEIEANKHNLNTTFKSRTNIRETDSFTTSINSKAPLVPKYVNNITEYSNDESKIVNSKSKNKKTSILLVSTDGSNNINKSHETNIKNKTVHIQTEDAKQNKKVLTNSNDKFKGGLSTSSISSLFKGTTQETSFSNALLKGEGSVSNSQLKARDTLSTDIRSANPTLRSRSAASTKSFNNDMSDPHKTINPSKTKSSSSFNELKLQDAVTKNMIRPIQSPKKEINTDFEMKAIDRKYSQDQENITAKPSGFKRSNILDKRQLELKSGETSTNKILHTYDKNSFNPVFPVLRKLQSSHLNEQKPTVKTNSIIGLTNSGKNSISNEKILCDFVEGLLDVNVRVEPQKFDSNAKYITNELKHCKNLKSQKNNLNSEKENKTKQFINECKCILIKNPIDTEKNKILQSTLTSKSQIIDSPEKHVTKLGTIVPSMKRISKPIYLVSKVSENQEQNKNILAVHKPIKDKKLEKIVNKQTETNSKATKENRDILTVDTRVKDRTVEKITKKETETEKKFVNENKSSKRNNLAVIATVKDKKLDKVSNKGEETKTTALKENKDLTKSILALRTPIKGTTLENSTNKGTETKNYALTENKELNKKILAVKTPVSDQTQKNVVRKGRETENISVKENNNLMQTRSFLNEITCDRTSFKNLITPNITKKLQELAIKKRLNNTLWSNLQKGEIKKDSFLNQETPTKTSVKSQCSSELKTKYQLISKKHKQFTNYTYEKIRPSTAAKLDSGSYEKSNVKDIINTHLSMSNKVSKRDEQDSNKCLNIAPSLSIKQTKLLMEQPFYRKPKSKPSIDNVLHKSKSEPSLVAPSMSKAEDISTLRELKLVKQPFYKPPKTDHYFKNLSNSKSDNNLPKSNHFTKYELHSSKSDKNMVKHNNNYENVISPRIKQSSIRNQLLRKIPMRAVIKQVSLKKNEQDK